MKSRRVEEGRVNLVWRCDVRKSTAILFPTLFVRVHPPSFYSVILTGKRTSRRVKVCRRESGGVINGRGTPRYRSLGVYPLQRRGYKFFKVISIPFNRVLSRDGLGSRISPNKILPIKRNGDDFKEFPPFHVTLS